jgi:hypothetical protein
MGRKDKAGWQREIFGRVEAGADVAHVAAQPGEILKPTATEVSYNDVKGWQKTKTKLDFQYISDADVANGLAEGDGVNNFGSGFFTESTFQGSAEADGIGVFSWSFTGTGVLDEYDDESPS